MLMCPNTIHPFRFISQGCTQEGSFDVYPYSKTDYLSATYLKTEKHKLLFQPRIFFILATVTQATV